MQRLLDQKISVIGLRTGSCLIQIALMGMWLLSSTALAGPNGASIEYGEVSISGAGGASVTVEQTSARAIIGWDDFDTKKNESIRFIQPNASSVAVNIIKSNSQTNFQGSLSANGQIVLVNVNGIVFSKTAKLDAAALVATTLDLDRNSFSENGAISFNSVGAGKPNAKIENKGLITIAEAGLAAFVSPIVKNSGVIEAEMGTVHLASGDTFVIDMAGDGLVSLAMSAEDNHQLLEHSGDINAAGGKVYLSAAVAEGIVDNVINMSGVIEAQNVQTEQGKILLTFAPKLEEEPVVDEPVAEEIPAIEPPEPVEEEPAPEVPVVDEEPVEIDLPEEGQVISFPPAVDITDEIFAPEAPVVDQVSATQPKLLKVDYHLLARMSTTFKRPTASGVSMSQTESGLLDASDAMVELEGSVLDWE